MTVAEKQFPLAPAVRIAAEGPRITSRPLRILLSIAGFHLPGVIEIRFICSLGILVNSSASIDGYLYAQQTPAMLSYLIMIFWDIWDRVGVSTISS